MRINKRLFHETSLNLAGLYLSIIMVISLVFSIAQYRLSANELDRAYRHQEDFAMNLPQFEDGGHDADRDSYLTQRAIDLTDAKHSLLIRLVGINLVILISGGALSYVLARRSLQPIEEAHEAQSRFTADASHELRTPLSVMQTEIEVALQDGKLTLSQAKKLLGSNLEELTKLTRLSEGLLRLAQLEQNDAVSVRLPAADVVSTAVGRVRPQAENRRITIDTVIRSGTLLGDETSLCEAVVTILDNAVKYSPPDSTVKVDAGPRANNYVITVSDKGTGIGPDQLPHIFERFYRAEQSRSKGAVKGYGLGLAICKSIMDAHGGTVSVKSAPSKGSAFTLSLPSAKGGSQE